MAAAAVMGTMQAAAAGLMVRMVLQFGVEMEFLIQRLHGLRHGI
jgi:hypothetical protein